MLVSRPRVAPRSCLPRNAVPYRSSRLGRAWSTSVASVIPGGVSTTAVPLGCVSARAAFVFNLASKNALDAPWGRGGILPSLANLARPRCRSINISSTNHVTQVVTGRQPGSSEAADTQPIRQQTTPTVIRRHPRNMPTKPTASWTICMRASPTSDSQADSPRKDRGLCGASVLLCQPEPTKLWARPPRSARSELVPRIRQ